MHNEQKNKSIAIIGAGGHSKVVLGTLLEINPEIRVTFYDENPQKTCIDNVMVQYELGDFDIKDNIHVAIGDNFTRAKHVNYFLTAGKVLPVISHPGATMYLNSKVMEASFIAAGAVIGPEAFVGRGAIINHYAVIEHDCVIGDYVSVSPSSTLCGGVIVGDFSFIGAGAVILPEVKIGKNVIVGAGAVVTKNISDNLVVAGVPARKIEYCN